MKSTQRRVERNINAYHLKECYGVTKAANKLKISINELMKRVREAVYYQASIINVTEY
jgi:hypothetical protein